MKKTIAIILTFLTFLTLSSCKKSEDYDITATLFPHYDIANNIVLDKMNVYLLTNPGVDIHDYSPSSKQMMKIKNSKLFLFTGYEVDTWLNENEKNIIGKNTIALNMSKGYSEELNHEHDEDDNDHDHSHVHYWTDPFVMIDLTNYVLEQIILIDPINKDFYIENASNYINKILNIHNNINSYFNDKENITLYFSGHNALHGFEHRYTIEIIALSNTSKPDADITSKQILSLINEIRENNIHYLFTEELKDLKLPNTIKNELEKENHKLTLLELHGYHNLTKEDFDKKVTYYDLLNRNFNNIKESLNYE